MSKLNFYKYAALALLCLNLLILAYFAFTKPGRGQGGHRIAAGDIMQLDKEQHDFFLKDAARHQFLVENIIQEQRQFLDPYFQNLFIENKVLYTDSILTQVQILERQKIESTYQHFLNIKQTLKPEQQAGFENFVNDALKDILFLKKKKPHRPKDF